MQEGVNMKVVQTLNKRAHLVPHQELVYLSMDLRILIICRMTKSMSSVGNTLDAHVAMDKTHQR